MGVVALTRGQVQVVVVAKNWPFGDRREGGGALARAGLTDIGAELGYQVILKITFQISFKDVAICYHSEIPTFY